MSKANLQTGVVTAAPAAAGTYYQTQSGTIHHGTSLASTGHTTATFIPERKILTPKSKGKPLKATGQPRYWTPEEHRKFMEAASIYGEKDVKAIAQYVATRTPTQVRTHAQKYAIRLRREAELIAAGIDPREAKKTGVKQALARAKEIMMRRKHHHFHHHHQHDDEDVEVDDDSPIPRPDLSVVPMTHFPAGVDDSSPGIQLFPATTASKPIAVPRPRLTEGDLYTTAAVGGRRRIEPAGAAAHTGITRSHMSKGSSPGGPFMARSPPFGSPFAPGLKRVRVGSITDQSSHYVQKHVHGHTHTHNSHDVDPFMISSVLGAASPSLSFLRAHGGLLSPAADSQLLRDGDIMQGGLAQLSLEDRLPNVSLPGMYTTSGIREESLMGAIPHSPLMSQLRDKSDDDMSTLHTMMSPEAGVSSARSVLQEVCPEILSLDINSEGDGGDGGLISVV